VQKKGGVVPAGRTEIADLNAKFDEVYKGEAGAQGSRTQNWPAASGIYQFMPHPQWLDYGADKFFEQHLAHIGRRTDVWYVPLDPLYVYEIARERTVVSPLRRPQQPGREGLRQQRHTRVHHSRCEKTHSALWRKDRAGKERKLTDHWDMEYFRRDRDSTLVTIRPNTILELRLTE
jgi:hypothetical protein